MSILPDDVNPFRAPVAGIGGGFEPGFGDDDAEVIRRAHIGHEASVKSLGILDYFAAFICAIVTFCALLVTAGLIPMNPPNGNPNALSPEATRLASLAVGVFYLFFSGLYLALGYGLRRLQNWARWTTVVLISLFLLYVLFLSLIAFVANPVIGLISLVVGSLIPGYILYLMVSAKGGMVFSPEYKAIIRKTPHVKYKTSIIVKIFLALLLLVIGLAVVAAIMSSMQR